MSQLTTMEPGWRQLTLDEIVRNDDEYLNESEDWIPVERLTRTFTPRDMGLVYRRRIGRRGRLGE